MTAAVGEALLVICGIWFIVTLLPTALDPESQVNVYTSLSNVILSFVYVFAYLQIGIWKPIIGTVLIAGIWAYIAVFRRSPSTVSLPTTDSLSPKK